MRGRTLLVGGRVIDPLNGIDAMLDVEVADGKVTALAVGLAPDGAGRILDVRGRVIMPGLIDAHTHLSGIGPVGRNGHRMMARAGVTTALDLSGDPEELAAGVIAAGAGLNVAYLRPVLPHRTVSGTDPSAAELERFVGRALDDGALGVKCLGGHFPITPAAIGRTIAAAARRGAYVAIHAGSTEHGSDIEGMEEAIAVADGHPMHMAHVNAYCRGQRTGDPLEETRRALSLLRTHPHVRSESYLSTFNGTGGVCDDGIPRSSVTRTCLRMGRFAATEAGLAAAIRAGWAHVWTTVGGETALVTGADGEQIWRDAATDVGLSFAVNPPAAAIALAVDRAPGSADRFTIDALSTDGGGIPRNTTLAQGLALVRFGALSMSDFVRKASTAGAAMLGLASKGHLAPGADADITVVDLEGGRPVLTLVDGEVNMVDGVTTGRGGTILTTARGVAAMRRRLAAGGPAGGVRAIALGE